MLSPVHGLYKAILVIILCSSIFGLRINQGDVVDEELVHNNVKIEIHEPLSSLDSNENDFEVIPEDVTNVSVLRNNAKRNQNEDLEEEIVGVILGEADNEVKRIKRQATHAYSPLYPQLPSGPPYNPYQTQPNNNPYGQNPYQPQPNNNPYGQNQQPSYNPSGQNSNQQQPSFNPYGQNPYQQQPSYNHSGQSPYNQRPQQWNPNSYNSSQPSYPGQNYNPNTGYHNTNQGPYNPYSSPGNSYRPPNGQHPLQNQTFNSPYTGNFRPTNGSGYTTPWPSYNAQAGINFRNNSYPGQPSFNSNYPHSSGNKYPFQGINATSQRPPYFNPNQYPSYNNSRPNPSQWPSSTNYPQYPNYPGAQPSSAYNPYVSQGSHNTTLPHGTPYYPGSNGQYPSNATFNPNYPAPNGSHTYNPSNPNYPLQNNQAQAYDPRRVPPQHFSYH